MYVECPHCQALYRITLAQMEAAEGWVRCGECGHIFDATPYLSIPNEPSAPVAAPEPFVAVEPSDHRVAIEPTSDIAAEAASAARPEQGHRDHRLGTALWSAAILLLIVLLGAQYLLSQREQYAQYPQLRPLLTQLCRVAGCRLPPQRDLKAITLVSRNVFIHPNIPHALMISATIMNDAPFPQPYPVLQISFSNLEGRTIALGRFSPVQYLPKGIDPHKLMPVDKPVHISFSVHDPGQQALAYQFSFR